MPKLYSRTTGKPVEVPDSIYNRAVEFKASAEGTILLGYDPDPVPWQETHYGMLQMGDAIARMDAEDAQKAAEQQAEAESRKLTPPPLNAEPGSGWDDLV